MTCPPARTDPPTHRLTTVALLTLLAFGCTTVRTPLGGLVNPVPVRDGVADPQLELWLESAKAPTPEEAAVTTAEARAALEAALAGRQVGDGSTVLVVREQGVTRSRSHKSDQAAATVGLVVGAVVVVVGIVVLLSQGKGGGGGAAKAAPHGAAAMVGRAPTHSPALPVALAGARPLPPPGLPRPRPPAGFPRPPPPPRSQSSGSGISYAVGVQLDLTPRPYEWTGLEEPYLEGPYAPTGDLQVVSSREWSAPSPLLPPGGSAAPGEPEAEEPPPEPLAAIALPPLPPLPVEERGFFDGDRLVLELTLADRETGARRWTKWVEAEVDPLDRVALRALLDKAFAEAAGWQAAPEAGGAPRR